MTLPVFLGEDLTPDPSSLGVGESAFLGGEEGRHAAVVRRMGVGESLDVVDGAGLRLRCEVTGVVERGAGRGLELRVDEVMTEETSRPRLTLVQALAKGGRDEQAVESAVEVGVDAVVPWQANRSIARWQAQKLTKGVAKWEQVVRAAAKQSRRAFVPEVGEPVDSRGLATLAARVVADDGLVLVCHEEGTLPLARLLAGGAAERAGEVLVVVGPEGGIDPDELASLRTAGAEVVLLGPHVLRSSSAGPAALTLVAAAVGRW